jgi:hypothetical protein
MSDNRSQFRKKLENLINEFSMENGSNTPDFLLAEYLVTQLNTWDQYVTRREEWYGRAPVPVEDSPEP